MNTYNVAATESALERNLGTEIVASSPQDASNMADALRVPVDWDWTGSGCTPYRAIKDADGDVHQVVSLSPPYTPDSPNWGDDEYYDN